MPLLGPIVDGFDDWLAVNGFTPGSRKLCIRMLWYVDADLRRRRVREVAELTHAVLHDCWRAFDEGPSRQCRNRTNTGTVSDRQRPDRRWPERDPATLPPSILATSMRITSAKYADSLRPLLHTTGGQFTCFLKHLEDAAVTLRSVQPSNIESYIAKTGKRLSRGALQHDIAAVGGFLRFLATDGRITSRTGSPDRYPASLSA